MRRLLYLAASFFVVLGLTACSEEPRDFTMYKAGQYKGTVDPLLAKNLDQELNTRFKQVQTDR
jgi:hypothetical protein